jgi:hypothetical protein
VEKYLKEDLDFLSDTLACERTDNKEKWEQARRFVHDCHRKFRVKVTVGLCRTRR